jgi:hypothetical protein
MMVGTAAVVVCYLVLGWTQEIVGIFVSDKELVRLKWNDLTLQENRRRNTC